MSGLKANFDKSHMFVAGLDPDERYSLLSAFNFKEGKFPVKYLGAPLTSNKFSRTMCYSLVDRITERISGWAENSLSYAGRLQLIKSIIFSMQVYWLGIFILPNSVTCAIERICRNFLWSGSINRSFASVAWAEVCKPKNEGGLGIIDIKLWNKAAIAKHIWAISTKKDSLWVKWIHMYHLKHKSFWQVLKSPNDEWCWRKLLKIRDLFKAYFKVQLGNGKNTSFWYDNWLPIGPLSDYITDVDIDFLGINKNITVVNMNRRGSWRIPNSLYGLIPNLETALKSVKLKDCDDKVFWFPGTVFSVKSAYACLQGVNPKVKWAKIIWDSRCIPKHSFISWLAFKNKISTRINLAKRGLSIPINCCFCGANESTDHLFFNCRFSSQVWLNICHWIGIQPSCLNWDKQILWITHKLKGKTCVAKMRRVVLTATIYHIWRARNLCIFQNTSLTVGNIILKIKSEVMLRLTSFPDYIQKPWFANLERTANDG